MGALTKQRIPTMADDQQTEQTRARRTFKKYSYRGVELDSLLDLSNEQFVDLVHCRARRRFNRGLTRKPATVKTHLRDMIIVPEMIGSVVGIYNGKVFNAVEIKPEMTGFYLGEFSITYKPVGHGRPGLGSNSTRFIPLK